MVCHISLNHNSNIYTLNNTTLSLDDQISYSTPIGRNLIWVEKLGGKSVWVGGRGRKIKGEG